MKVKLYVNGYYMGVYEGNSNQDILDAYSQDAGYKNYVDMINRLNKPDIDEYEFEETG